MVLVATLLSARHYRAYTGFCSPSSHHLQISPKNSLIIIIVSVLIGENCMEDC